MNSCGLSFEKAHGDRIVFRRSPELERKTAESTVLELCERGVQLRQLKRETAGLIKNSYYRLDRGRAGWHGMIAAMARRGSDPIAKFIRWLDDAQRVRIPNYEAMALATATRGGKTSVRFVLLKGIDERGFVFFTNARSRKGRELRSNPHASLAFYWQLKGRQVRVEGRVEEVTPAEADAYWPTRPRQSQLAASASHQSARLRSRAELLARFARLVRKFRGREVPRPPIWTGFRMRPDAIEFWTHREHRLHDREIYLRHGREWRRDLLQP